MVYASKVNGDERLTAKGERLTDEIVNVPIMQDSQISGSTRPG